MHDMAKLAMLDSMGAALARASLDSKRDGDAELVAAVPVPELEPAAPLPTVAVAPLAPAPVAVLPPRPAFGVALPAPPAVLVAALAPIVADLALLAFSLDVRVAPVFPLPEPAVVAALCSAADSAEAAAASATLVLEAAEPAVAAGLCWAADLAVAAAALATLVLEAALTDAGTDRGALELVGNADAADTMLPASACVSPDWSWLWGSCAPPDAGILTLVPVQKSRNCWNSGCTVSW